MKAQTIVTSQGRIVALDITVNYCHDMKLFKMSSEISDKLVKSWLTVVIKGS